MFLKMFFTWASKVHYSILACFVLWNGIRMISWVGRYIKWAYHEYPFHVGAHVFSGVGVLFILAANYNFYVLKDGRIRYRDDFIVVRDGDPILNYVPLEGRYIPLDQRK